ncbi:hypothetical protein BCU70_05830 [Vibrio sp. 10N.286.49.C2]|uniref:glycosyltransferase n=1 Tax=unclassified Vibrio TaxID=2614977 RepID=UPI000C858C0A|nr:MULTISPECIES: glycosyltransferase [unclassified Vibrio]PMH31423.1 hypothetical protein BCU70_05830 [Vibrio sp. 10N.286.49.C2]PMH50444.1 hypothetical protein BCU66_18190 [Vibrio sp. 10N.286.49.B1]PMH78073.1 hypothetical protein BCU58_11125 [Vibrio sp. 10N.286.48.B7]
MKNILYVHFGDNWIRGSEQCLLQLIGSLETQRFCPIVWTNNPALHDKLISQGVSSYLDSFTLMMGGYQPNFDVKNWLSLVLKGRTLIRNNTVDAIHVNSGAPCQWMNLVAKYTKTPLVTQLHSDYLLSDRFWLAIHLSPTVVTVSHAISESLLSDGFPKQRLEVIHNGIANPSVITHQPSWVKDRLGIKHSTLLFATVGSLIHRKGIDRLLNALVTLKTTLNPPHLLIIGDGELNQALQSLATHLKVDNQVTFVGEQDNVAAWLQGGVDGFISGAREEAFGLVVAEAGLAQLPIIAPNIGGIPEFVTHNVSALLYDNDRELLDCWQTLIEQYDTLAPKISQQAHNYISNNLSIEANTHALQRVYDVMISNQNNRQTSLFAAFRPLKTLAQRYWTGVMHNA